MYSLATWYSETARGAEALRLTEEVVELQKSKLGEDYPSSLASERLLAHLCQGTEETSSTLEFSPRPRRSKPKFLRWFRSGKGM